MRHKNSLSQHKTDAEKNFAYNRDAQSGAVAYNSAMQTTPLSQLHIDTVEFVGGLWRIQNPLNREITTVRDKKFILGARLDVVEKNLFDFYLASLVGINCYGPFIGAENHIVAKYITDKGTYWSYGKTPEQARAFLGIKLYDEYMDLIHTAACKNSQKKK